MDVPDSLLTYSSFREESRAYRAYEYGVRHIAVIAAQRRRGRYEPILMSGDSP
jgi:hypothetical protein